MHFQTLFTYLFATSSILYTLTSAGECLMKNEGGSDTKETDTKVCQTQGEGSWAFYMKVQETGTGLPTTFNSPSLGAQKGGASFYIYDNDCILRGTYSKPDCNPGNWVIRESFLPWTLNIKSVFMDVGQPEFKFAYADGMYQIGENHCGCEKSGSFPTVVENCKCAFPIHGEPDKKRRELEWEA